MRISDWSSDVCSSDLAREPDASRMIRAYNQSAATLNLVRAFSTGGYASLDRVHGWMLDFMGRSPWAAKFEAMADQIGQALDFMRACGLSPETVPQLGEIGRAHV